MSRASRFTLRSGQVLFDWILALLTSLAEVAAAGSDHSLIRLVARCWTACVFYYADQLFAHGVFRLPSVVSNAL